jgi:polyhydroxyalkanoate synthesis regulator phasin
MNRIVTALTFAFALASTSAVALADTGKATGARHERGDKAAMEKKFPMAGAEFQQKATERAAKGRERMEKRLTEKQVPTDKANEIRAKFAATQAKVAAKVTEVVADGTVTLDEAKAVHAVAREGRPEHKGGHGKTARKGQKLARKGSLLPSARPLLVAMVSECPDDR